MKKRLPALFLALWAAALCVPQAARLLEARTGLLGFEPFPAQTENRYPAPFPDLFEPAPRKVPHSLYGRALEFWYGDRFAWRTELIRFARRLTFERLRAPIGRDVPGRDGWRFMRISWQELEDYLGAIPLNDAALAEWVLLLEGRHAWADACGTAVLTFLTTPKAQVRPQFLPPAVRVRRGRRIADQLVAALADSPARDDLLLVDGDLAAGLETGREVFFKEDHHPTPYGTWILYDGLNRRLRQRYPDRIGDSLPWYDDPPPAVLAGEAPGCWERNGRLAVSSPGERQGDGFPRDPARYPYVNVETVREGGGLEIVLAHDSFLRFTLESWLGRDGDARIPLADGVGRVRMFLFRRITGGFLESESERAVPAAFVDQFPEFRLAESRAGRYLDDNLRAAAAFGRAADPAPGRAPRAGERVCVRAVLDHLRADGSVRRPWVVLSCGGRELARRDVAPGVKRAVFFDAVDWPAGGGAPTLSLEGGSAGSTNLAWRFAAP